MIVVVVVVVVDDDDDDDVNVSSVQDDRDKPSISEFIYENATNSMPRSRLLE